MYRRGFFGGLLGLTATTALPGAQLDSKIAEARAVLVRREAERRVAFDWLDDNPYVPFPSELSNWSLEAMMRYAGLSEQTSDVVRKEIRSDVDSYVRRNRQGIIRYLESTYG